jgi:glycosyltransferase involved in cell wall biosynthesis
MAKILFIHDTARLSGPANSLLKMYQYLKADHDITVALPGQGSFTHVLDEKKIPWKVFTSSLITIPALMNFLRLGKFDLIYGNNFSRSAWIGLIASKLIRKPFVWHIREIFAPDTKHLWMVRSLRFSSAIIAVSESSSKSIQYHLPKQFVHVVHNGVELREFSLSQEHAKAETHARLGLNEGEILVISVGHICARKNQIQAVETAAYVIKSHPFVKFCFWGLLTHSPEYTIALKKQIDQLGIGDNVFLPGFQENIVTYLRGADIFLHTALKDPHPRSVLEGMASGLPVVAYDVDGVSETVVSGETGYLVPLNDVKMLAQKITELVDDPALRVHMGQAGIDRIQNLFTAEQTAQQVNEVIKRVIHTSNSDKGINS